MRKLARSLALAVVAGDAISDGGLGQAQAASSNANPVNFQQVGAGVDIGGGKLQFHYLWSSSTGNLADLDTCRVGEIVVYPDASNPYQWPDPPDATELSITARPVDGAGVPGPVYVDIDLKNLRKQDLKVELGDSGKTALRFKIVDPTGRTQSVQLSEAGLSAPLNLTLGSGGFYNYRILLNEWYEFHMPGLYEVELSLQPDADTTLERPPLTAFQLKIGPRDPSSIRRLAERLATRFITGNNFEDRFESARTLSLMTDPVVVDSLSRALRSGTGDGDMLGIADFFVDGLVRIGGTDAASALDAALRSQDQYVRRAAQNGIDRMLERKPAGQIMD